MALGRPQARPGRVPLLIWRPSAPVLLFRGLWKPQQRAGPILDFPHTGGLASGSQDRFKGNEMLAWHRWQLGWIEDSEVFCATSSTTSIKLGPLTKNLGSRMLVMPVDSSRVIVAENRAI